MASETSPVMHLHRWRRKKWSKQRLLINDFASESDDSVADEGEVIDCGPRSGPELKPSAGNRLQPSSQGICAEPVVKRWFAASSSERT